MLKATALEELLKLLLDALRQGSAMRRELRLERGNVLLNESVQKGAFGAMAHIRRRTDSRAGFPASW